MQTTYVPHIFGDDVEKKLSGRRGWLTVGVAASIPWPPGDVCVLYAGDEYFLRGTEQNGGKQDPCIHIACDGHLQEHECLRKIYNFASILGWFHNGYVYVYESGFGSHPILYSSQDTHSSLGAPSAKHFNCNYMPVIENESIHTALAFWNEGERLYRFHDGYAFLSFYKIIESQFSNAKDKITWIDKNLKNIKERNAIKQMEKISKDCNNIGKYLFDSGRSAVAHASPGEAIISPNMPEARKRISDDIIIMKELAKIYISKELQIPDYRDLYRTRNRLEPWNKLIPPKTLHLLQSGGTPKDFTGLEEKTVSIGLWADAMITGLKDMTMHISSAKNGIVNICVLNKNKTIKITFDADYTKGQMNIDIEKSGLIKNEPPPSLDDAKTFCNFFHKTLRNGIIELTIDGYPPIVCDAYMPKNIIITETLEKAIEDDIALFKDYINSP